MTEEIAKEALVTYMGRWEHRRRTGHRFTIPYEIVCNRSSGTKHIYRHW